MLQKNFTSAKPHLPIKTIQKGRRMSSFSLGFSSARVDGSFWWESISIQILSNKGVLEM